MQASQICGLHSGDELLLYQENCHLTEKATMCQQDVVERSVGDYTYARLCKTEWQSGPYRLTLLESLPTLLTPKKEHILHFIKELAKGLVGSNVPEVKFDLTARDPLDFDARLFFSDTVTAYPHLYRESIKEWY